jgi:nucleoside-diphosphate-sugar epimerase
LQAGHVVCGVSRRGAAYAGESNRWQSITVDASDGEALAAALRDREFDVVVDLVSFAPAQLQALLRLFAGRCGQYMFVSSATVYEGVQPPNRLTEDARRVVGPWSYPQQKIDCEALLASEAKVSGQAYTVVRPYITYSDQRLAFGVWETHDVLGRLEMGWPVVIGDDLVDTATSLTHASDLARGMVELMGNSAALNEDVHIASDETTTWREVFEKAADLLGGEANIVASTSDRMTRAFPELQGKLFDRALGRSFDNSKFLRMCPDFRFECSFEEGYASALDRLRRPGEQPRNQTFQGRLDRLAADSASGATVLGDMRSFFATAQGQPMQSRARYTVGRSQRLFSLKQRTVARRRKKKRPSAHTYGIE